MSNLTDRGRGGHLAPLITVCVLCTWIAPALAEESPEPPERAQADERPYRNPQGALLLNGSLGLSVGSGVTYVGVGIGAGYAVVTGVVPGARGLVLFGSGATVGEVAATLTLTPPLRVYTLPFVIGEVGGRFEPAGRALVYGVGGGLYLGEADSTFAFQVGWMWRRAKFGGELGTFDISGPILSLSIRF